MYSASSINLPVPAYPPLQSDNCRSKLKGIISRFGRHSTEHSDITRLKDSRSAISSTSLAENFTSYAGAEMFDNDDIAWSRPSSRATTSRQSGRVKRQPPKATAPQGQAEMLDDDNNAWTRPPRDVFAHGVWGRSRA